MNWQLIGNLSGKNGANGQDAPAVDVDAIAASVVKQVSAAKDARISALEKEIEQLREWLTVNVKAEIETAVKAIPVPSDGRDGRDADPLLIKAEVEKAVAALPLPPVVYPVSIAGALIDRDGHLVLTFTDGETKDVGKVEGGIGPQGIPGKAGSNGTIDNIKVLQDPENPRSVRLLYKDSGQPIEGGELYFPAQVYQGVFSIAKTYELGDVVTWAGSLWHAKGHVVGVKPDEHMPDSKRMWQLIVKRGSEGKAGPPGAKGLDGKDGRNGKDWGR